MHLNAEPDQPEPEAQPLVITEPEPCLTGTVIVYGEGVRESVYNGRMEGYINSGPVQGKYSDAKAAA